MFAISRSRLLILTSASLVATLNQAFTENSVCESPTKNQAFVFVKPHANTPSTQLLVSETFHRNGIKILSEGELSGEEIDKGKLIDQHYYAIASKATLLKPHELPVPADKFEKTFGIGWKEALAKGKVYNAIDACQKLNIDADELDKAWGPSKKVKFGGGFYCGLVSIPGKEPIYVFNAFFMSMRKKYVLPGTSIHYYVVEFSPLDTKWADFRGNVLGPTNPADAPSDSLRGMILKDWKKLGLKQKPNVGDNGVHASASPFEALAERANWLQVDVKDDSFGQQLIKSGISEKTIKHWSVDPQVKGGSLFDALEDLDSDECVAKAKELNK